MLVKLGTCNHVTESFQPLTNKGSKHGRKSNKVDPIGQLFTTYGQFFLFPPCAIGIIMSNLSCSPTNMMSLFRYMFNKSDFSISIVSDFAGVLYATPQEPVSFSCITPATFVKDVTNTLFSVQTLLKKPSVELLT